MLLSVTVTSSVVLVEHLAPHQPEVAPGHESAVHPELVLRGHCKVADNVKQAEQSLERGLGSTVGQEGSKSQPPNAESARGDAGGELIRRDVSEVNGAVDDHDHVEKPHVACDREQRLGR